LAGRTISGGGPPWPWHRGDVSADLVDDDERDPAELDQFDLQGAGVVRVGEAGDQFGGGGERDAVSDLAGAQSEPDGQEGYCSTRCSLGQLPQVTVRSLRGETARAGPGARRRGGLRAPSDAMS
jgi:hypothetical protein